MLLKSQKDFFSGLLFMTVGGAFAYGATTYQVGTAARMGPGYFPLLLGVILALMGVVIAVRSFIAGTPDGDHIGAIAWKPLLLVLGANVAFGADDRCAQPGYPPVRVGCGHFCAGGHCQSGS